MRPPPLLLILGVLFFGGGLYVAARSLLRLLATIRASRTYGAPYRRGQIADRALGFLMSLPLAPCGAALLVLALGQAAFQATVAGAPLKVGELEGVRSGWGRTTVTIVPDAAYPERRTLEGSIEGARFAVVGDFLDWAPGVRWLGLVPAHRLRALAGADDVGGGGARGQRVVRIDAAPRLAGLLLSLDRWLPMLTVREGSTPWLPQAAQTRATLYVTSEGYVVDSVAVP
jgi:hypothetical protein